MKPQTYNKQKTVRGMDRAVDRAQREEDRIFELFFSTKFKDEEQASMRYAVKKYVNDQVSKDLDIPYHQIGSEQVQTRRDKGFVPVNYHDWWKGPTEEEKKKMIMKMLSGASLRKDLYGIIHSNFHVTSVEEVAHYGLVAAHIHTSR
jgi:hypothetical protein